MMSAKRLVLCAGACVATVGINTVSLATPPTPEYVFGRDVVDYPNTVVPGCPGEIVASNNGIDYPTIDNNGNIALQVNLDTSLAFGVATMGTRAIYLYGGPGSMQLVARDGGVYGSGDWPHLPNVNHWVTNAIDGGPGLSPGATVSPGGVLFLSASMNGTGANANNNSGFWTGIYGSVAKPIAQVAQEGFLPAPNGRAPGTSGAVWSSSLQLMLAGGAGNRCNDAGQVNFVASLAGGDVDGTNDQGMFVGSPSGITMVARNGRYNIPGVADPSISSDAIPNYGWFMNHQGEVAYVAPLTVGTGETLPVTNANRSCIWTNLGTGGMTRVIARAGDFVPWDPTGSSGLTCSSGLFGQLNQAMSSQRSYLTTINVNGPGVITSGSGENDLFLAKYHWNTANNTGTWTHLLREGDPSGLIPHGMWGIVNWANSGITSNDGVYLSMTLQDDGTGAIDNTNDECLVMWPAGDSMMLVAHEGELLSHFLRNGHTAAENLPGLPADAVFAVNSGLFPGATISANAQGQVVFRATISGTGILVTDPLTGQPPYSNEKCLFAWDPVNGLMLLARTGTSDGTDGGVTFTPLTFNGAPGIPVTLSLPCLGTGEGTTTGVTDSGWIVFRAGDGFGNASVFRAHFHRCGSADFNCDGDIGTDADIEAFFACLAGSCPVSPCQNNADFNDDGDIGTDADIEAFFRVLAGGAC
jgi:hypothetical protein